MKLRLFVIIILLFFVASPALAQSPEEEIGHNPGEEFYRAEVVEILQEDYQQAGDNTVLNQLVKVKITSGDKKGQELEIENSGVFTVSGGQGVKRGDQVVIYKVNVLDEGDVYYIADNYRLTPLIFIVLLFFLLAIVFSRWKGVTSIIGLLISIGVIVKFVVPQISNGQNPIFISLIAALVIALTSIYLSHGFSKRTTIALAGTLITLLLAAIFSSVFVSLASLFGLGSEQAFYLQFGALENLNLQGLLLGGIILGALGVLDDITTAQSATVDEIKKANPALTFRELYESGSSVGREHIASLVNTLFLAYAGAALPMFLFFTTNSQQPLWVTLNAEFVAEEIVRTMVGSIALILAVPITTLLAAYFFSKDKSLPTVR